MATSNDTRTREGILKEMEAKADGDPQLAVLADEFVATLADSADKARGPDVERPRRQRPPRA